MNWDLSFREVLCMIRRILLSMVPMENPPIIAIYTSHHKDGLEQQSIAYSNDKGLRFEKSYLIRSSKTREFPISVTESVLESGQKMLESCSCSQDRVFFYASQDMKNWEKTGEFGPEGNHVKGVWEMPWICSRLSIRGKIMGSCCQHDKSLRGRPLQNAVFPG